MKILLIAYEFPPSPSPQALRWTYLSAELARRGHEVHVLTPDLGPELDTPNGALDSRVVVHRAYAGPMRGFIAWHRRRRAAALRDASDAGIGEGAAEESPSRPQRPPLKVRLVNLAYRLSEWIWFPDIRGEWRPFASSALKRILASHRFDVVVSSHEPATCLQLALALKQRMASPWVADLGDPVLAPYTPKRWRGMARRLERATCEQADAITVTAETAATLLRARHPNANPITVVTQGFSQRAAPPISPPSETLELAYVGSFYSFRRAEALFEAVAATPGVRLSVASISLPSSLSAIARANPHCFRMMGFLAHSEALNLQSAVHVLVNIANRDAAQVPGKLYEYLGAARPILHVTHDENDPGALLVRDTRRGWVVGDDVAAISRLLGDMRDRMTDGAWLDDVDLSMSRVQAYAWSSLGERLESLLLSVARST